MENTTKALLIVAGILIVIVVIALGILLTKNIGNTSDKASETGKKINNATDIASIDVMGGLKGLIISKKKFNDIFDDFYNKYESPSQIKSEILKKNDILNNQIELIGYVYTKCWNEIWDEEGFKQLDKNTAITSEYFATQIADMEKRGSIVRLNNPIDDEEIEKKLAQVTGKENFAEWMQHNKKGVSSSWMIMSYDKTGYINKICFVIAVKNRNLLK